MKYVAVVMAAVLLATGCSNEQQQAPLVASDIAIARPMPGMQMTAAYMTLTNNTAQQITLTEVTSREFAAVQMHETVIENGIAKMHKLGEVAILPGDSVVFEPGARHLMLMQPRDQTNNVTLEFTANDTVLLSISVAFTD